MQRAEPHRGGHGGFEPHHHLQRLVFGNAHPLVHAREGLDEHVVHELLLAVRGRLRGALLLEDVVAQLHGLKVGAPAPVM
jgi:hypothetical protein